MTAILGISAFYHDSAAALVVDGEIVAAAQEERFSRVKNDRRFPAAAIGYCLETAGITARELDFVSFYEKPLLKFDRVLETNFAVAPRGFRSFARSMPSWLKLKLHVTREFRRHLPEFARRPLFAEHHEAHAASAFFPSPFEEAAILTVDGVGEWATATMGVGRGNRIELLRELRFPHSVGLLYSAFTYYCGFEVDSGEYKLMGLAPYGEPTYVDVILNRIVDLRPDGSLWLDLSYFDYCHGLRMTSAKFHQLFGGPPREPDEPLQQRHLDIAASIQRVTEDILLRMARHIHSQTGKRRLCLAGGVALNAVANGRILTEGPFEDVWIQPAAGDSGGALGAALLVWHQLQERPRTPSPADSQRGSLLGPEFAADQIRTCLNERGAAFRELADEASLCTEVARLLAAQKVVGWFQGRMEFGPRALGNRSILADARNAGMQAVLNQKIKFRESFRPFAPAILAECAVDFFQLPATSSSPYMLLVTELQPSQRTPISNPEPQGLERLNIVRSQIPAVTHVDDSARLQTVDAARNATFAALLQEFRRQTGCPLLVNTSFNVRDEPIVCSPADAYDCFLATDMDVLVLGKFVLLKEQQMRTAVRPRPPGNRSRQSPTPALLAGERFFDLNETATPRQLRVFGMGLLVLTGLLLLVAVRSSTWTMPWWTLAGATAVTAAVFGALPAARQSIYRIYSLAAYPVSWAVSLCALSVIYYLVLTPIALCRRLCGHDVLQLRADRSAATWWRERRTTVDRERYLRQF
ncbi:MAG: carbamoyltransferase [Planctomycetaceae bacterium]